MYEETVPSYTWSTLRYLYASLEFSKLSGQTIYVYVS